MVPRICNQKHLGAILVLGNGTIDNFIFKLEVHPAGRFWEISRSWPQEGLLVGEAAK